MPSRLRRISPSMGVREVSNTGRIAIDNIAEIRKNLPKLCVRIYGMLY